MSLQRSFAADPSLSDRLFDLLAIAFPDLEIRQWANVGRDLGAPWEAASVPFMELESERVISHVGVLELPLHLMGQFVVVGGIHGVATHPDFRRRGYYRHCMEAALAYCDARYQTLLLTTPQPELYEPFGFRVVPEFVFEVPGAGQTDQKNGLRVLDLAREGDHHLLHRLLETRIPLSDVVGVYPEKAVFCVNEASRPLYYVPDLDVLLAMEYKEQRLHLFDIVTHHPLTLTSILQYLPYPIQETLLYFSPDRLDVQAQALPHALEDAFLMVRGLWAAEGRPFMLPRSARC